MSDGLHLSPDHRGVLEALLREHLPDVEVWAYGCRVNGRSHAGSDLDLALRGPRLEEIPAERLADFEDAVRDSAIPFLVSARDWSRLPASFRREIEQDHLGLVDPLPPSNDWPVMTLRDAGVRLIDCVHKTPAARESGYPYIAIPQMKSGRIDFESARRISHEDFLDWTKKAMPQPHDVVLSRRTNPGVTAIDRTGTEFALGQNLILLRADGSRVKPAFLKWLVRSPAWWREIGKYLNVGALFDSLRCADVPNFELPIPPLLVQHRIGALLDALDDKIELNRRMNETLEAMARALFKSWFVDFEPIRAKMAGRDTGLPDHLADLFPNNLDHKHKPCGWSLGTLAALARVNPESWSSRNVPERVEYVDLANTKRGAIELTQCFRWQDAPSRARRILRPGDTIIGTVRPGNGSYALIAAHGLTGSTGFAVLRARRCHQTAFVFLAATARENIERLSHLADGAAYPAIRPDVVGATPAAVPDDALMAAFSEVASPVLDQIESNKVQNETLAQVRELLLPKLISGEVRATQAERAVEAVAGGANA